MSSMLTVTSSIPNNTVYTCTCVYFHSTCGFFQSVHSLLHTCVLLTVCCLTIAKKIKYDWSENVWLFEKVIVHVHFFV